VCLFFCVCVCGEERVVSPGPIRCSSLGLTGFWSARRGVTLTRDIMQHKGDKGKKMEDSREKHQRKSDREM
jgi:hypothetical protein